MNTIPSIGQPVRLCNLTTNSELNNVIATCLNVLPPEPFDPYKDNEISYYPSIIIRLDFPFKDRYIFKIHHQNYCCGLDSFPSIQKEIN